MKRQDIRKFNKIYLPEVEGEKMSHDAQCVYSYIRALCRKGPKAIHTSKLMEVARENYLVALTELRELDLVIRINPYQKGVVAYTYALTKKALTAKHKYVLAKAWDRLRLSKKDKINTGSAYLNEVFKTTTLSVKCLDMWEKVGEVDKDLFNYMRLNIVSIYKREFNQSISDVCGRNYHTICQMVKELRQFLLIDDEETVELDCNTLFPRLLKPYLKTKKELETYNQMISRDFYEPLQYVLRKDRGDTKIAFNKWLNGGHEPLLDTFMKSVFPSIFELDRENGVLGIELMKKESFIMIDKLENFCKLHNLKYIPIHDGCIVKDKDFNTFKVEIERLFKKYYDIKIIVNRK